MFLSEVLQKKLADHIRLIPSMIGKQLKTEKSINPAYTDIEHASLCPHQPRIWALRADPSLTLAVGIKNRWTEWGNAALKEHVDPSMHTYIDVNDPYGHPSLAMPEEGYKGGVYYAGWLYHDNSKAYLLLYTGRYHNETATSLQKKLLEQYIAHQLITTLKVEEVIFIEHQKNHDIQYFLQNNLEQLKNRTQQTHTVDTILETLEENLKSHDEFIWDVWSSVAINEPGLIQLIKDKTSLFYNFSPFKRQFKAWSAAQELTQLKAVLVEHQIHLTDLETLSAQQCFNLVFGPTRAFPEIQSLFYTQGQRLGLVDCSDLLNQVKTADDYITQMLDILSQKEWLSPDIVSLLLNTPAHDSYKIKNVIQALSFTRLNSEIGPASVKTILSSMDGHEDPNHMVDAIKKLEKLGLLKSMAHTEHFMHCLTDHPSLEKIAFWSDCIDQLLFNITDATPGMSFAPSIDEWFTYLKTDPTEIDLGLGWGAAQRVLTQRTRFDMACNGKNAIGITTLCQALTANRTVKKLSFSQVSLRHTDLRVIAALLANNQCITELQFGHCDIDGPGVTILAEGLRKNTSLAHLDLVGNPIGDQGAEILSKLIQDTHSIKLLRLSGCKIGDQGIEKLVPICKANLTHSSLFFQKSPSESLDTLWIDDNSFGSAGLLALITPNLSLKKLVFSNNPGKSFDTHTMKTLFECLLNNDFLDTLDLSGCALTISDNVDANDVLKSLMLLLEKNVTLKHVQLGKLWILGKSDRYHNLLEGHEAEIQLALCKNPNKIRVYGVSGMPYDIAERVEQRSTHTNSCEATPLLNKI